MLIVKKLVPYCLPVLILIGYTDQTVAQVRLSGKTAGAELVSAITITNTTPLNFGVISIPATKATVVMNRQGTRTPEGATIVQTGTHPDGRGIYTAAPPQRQLHPHPAGQHQCVCFGRGR